VQWEANVDLYRREVFKGWDWEIGSMGRMNRGYDESPIQYAINGGR